MTKYSKQDLIDFETEIGECFNNGIIKAPIHLYSGNEAKIIEIFEKIKDEDWIFCTWRSHYQCLLKGVPKDRLRQDILDGNSITLCYPEFNIYSSAIVTGSIPISVGVALDKKIKNESGHVWCFVGDMASETGAFFENWKYAVNHNLPITFIVWNSEVLFFQQPREKVIYYQYESIYPHAGAGKRIQF